jgi:membrane peptidoglycan carboxypeptidase
MIPMRLARLIARGLGIVAAVFLGKQWSHLRQALLMSNAEYQASLKPEIPEALILALVVAEDRRFFQHGGVDFRALCRAFWKNISLQAREGGSTIEQQLVRQLTGMRDRSIGRKVKEILLASLVDTVMPKFDIPGVYLSVAYFGWQMNGLQQTCARLGVELPNLTQRQCAAIVSRLKYPEPKDASPGRTSQIAQRTNYILNKFTGPSGQQFATEFQLKVAQDAAVSNSRFAQGSY